MRRARRVQFALQKPRMAQVVVSEDEAWCEGRDARERCFGFLQPAELSIHDPDVVEDGEAFRIMLCGLHERRECCLRLIELAEGSPEIAAGG